MNNYLIKSSSPTLIDKKIDELIKKHEFTDAEINIYDLEESSITSLIEDADTISFLTPNKVIIGRNLSQSNFTEKDINTLNKYLSNPNNDVILIFTTSNIDTRKKSIKEIISKLTTINIETTPKEIIKDLFKDYDIEYKVISLLEEYYSDNLERLVSECQKLKLAFIDTKKISYTGASELLVKPLNKRDNLAFDLVREIALKDKKKAINIYNELLSYNIESYSLIGLLESQYRLLYQVKVLNKKNISYNDIAKELEVHPFRVKKTLELIRFYTLKEIRKLIKNLADVDFKIKSGIYENNIIIDLLILNIK